MLKRDMYLKPKQLYLKFNKNNVNLIKTLILPIYYLTIIREKQASTK